MFVTDVWDDIRELTSGYFAGDEALRDAEGNRLHKQQAPISTPPSNYFSPLQTLEMSFSIRSQGSGTTLVVAEQLGRKSIGIELDSHNVTLIQNRLAEQRDSDDVSRFFKDYACTPDLEAIWGAHGQSRKFASSDEPTAKQMAFLESNQSAR